MGYLFPMVAVFILNIPMAFFPRDLPKHDDNELDNDVDSKSQKVAMTLEKKEKLFDSVEEINSKEQS